MNKCESVVIPSNDKHCTIVLKLSQNKRNLNHIISNHLTKIYFGNPILK